MRYRDIGCKRAVDMTSDYIAGVLSAEQERRLETHLAACPTCRQTLAELRLTIDWVSRLPRRPAPDHLRNQIVERVTTTHTTV